MATAIEINNVSKHFRLNHARADSLKERVINFRHTTHDEFWALRDVTIQVEQGETVGLLGHNGSGKSTLLKCVAGIMRPTKGTIRKWGRTAALLELGAGFHGDLTGRENIYMNGSILGLSRVEIDKIFDDIVDFSEIEQFIDNQVKHYSSGMAARLGFAVAVNVEPEILLVDEVLAVGDEAFQRKCLDRIKQFQREGRTILLVTHAVDLVRQICDRAAVLDHGNLVAIGAPGEAALAFREHLRKKGAEVPHDLNDPTLLRNFEIEITDARVVYSNPDRAYLLPSEPISVEVDYHAPERVEDVVFSIAVHDQEGKMLLGTNTDLMDDDPGFVDGDGTCVFDFERFPVRDGVYLLSVGIHSHDGGVIYDQREEKDTVEVLSQGREVGLVHFPVRARVEPRSTPIAR
jgi:ABC-type polysaccharide/polyol phosphate transport system, ATPase component